MRDDIGAEGELSEEEIARVRAALLEHAQEIALAAAAAGDGWLVVALVGRDGTWGGVMTATEHDQAAPYLRADQVTFVVPARCRTAQAVQQIVREHLGGDEAP